jgi:UDP-glucose 4-epimerase
LLREGYQVVVLDNLCNSKADVVQRVQRLTNRPLTFIQGDIRDRDLLRKLFAEHDIAAVMHFAGLKAVGESVQKPLLYYDVNVGGAISLLDEMRNAGCRRMIFSSSATVYGGASEAPFTEDAPVATTNPYGETKLQIERILSDLCAGEPAWRAICLRYFNPVGADESGILGEDPNDVPNNLFPYIAQVAAGVREKLHIFGNDYPTPDRTGVRDYLHVSDLASGHVAALNFLLRASDAEAAGPTGAGWRAVNLGTGKGVSVLEALAAWSDAVGRRLPRQISPRRPGDVAVCYADASLAERLFGWRAQRGLAEMCRDHWRWQQWRSDNA